MFKSLTFAGAALLTVFILPLSVSAKDQSPNLGAIITHAIFHSATDLYEVRSGQQGNRRHNNRGSRNYRTDGHGYQHSPYYQYRGNNHHGRTNGRGGNKRALAHALTDYVSHSLNHNSGRRGYGRSHSYSVHVKPSSVNFGRHVNYSAGYRHNTGYSSQYDNCRRFKAKVKVDGHKERARGVACRDSYGSWEIVDLNY